MLKKKEIYEPRGCGASAADDIDTPVKEGWAHGSNICQGPGGDLVCVWYAGSAEKHEDVQIWMSKKPPGAGSWQKPWVCEKEGRTSEIPEEMEEFSRQDKGYHHSSEGNPVIYYEEEQDRLHLWWVTIYGFGKDRGWSTGFIKYKHSDDGGKSWVLGDGDVPRLLHDFWGEMIKNHPIKLYNGDVLLPAMTEWTSYSPVYYKCTVKEFAKGCLESQWTKVGAPGTGCFQPTLVELEPGHVLSLLRVSKTSKFNAMMAQQESMDFGTTWGEARANDWKIPNCNANSDAVRLANGHVVLVFNDSPETRNPLTVALSDDGCKTFKWKRDLERRDDDKYRFGYPSVCQGSDGTIHATYTYDPSRNIMHASFDEDWIKTGS